jgi:hypothetical protein
LSSGQVSPICEWVLFFSTVLHYLVLWQNQADVKVGKINRFTDSPENSAVNLSAPSDHERRVSAFNRTRPFGGYQSRISSWSDPVSARDILDGDGSPEAGDDRMRENNSGRKSNKSDVKIPPHQGLKTGLEQSSKLSVAEAVEEEVEEDEDLERRLRESLFHHR